MDRHIDQRPKKVHDEWRDNADDGINRFKILLVDSAQKRRHAQQKNIIADAQYYNCQEHTQDQRTDCEVDPITSFNKNP